MVHEKRAVPITTVKASRRTEANDESVIETTSAVGHGSRRRGPRSAGLAISARSESLGEGRGARERRRGIGPVYFPWVDAQRGAR